MASVVKRAASCAGASRSMRARSAAHEMGEHAPLQLADHQQHDLLDLRVLEILRRRLHRGDDDHQDRNLVEDARVAVGEHREGVVDHHRVERRGARHDAGEQQHEQQAAPVVADVLAPQAAKQGAGRVAPTGGRGEPIGRSSPEVVSAARQPRQFRAGRRRRPRRSRRSATMRELPAATLRLVAPIGRRAPARPGPRAERPEPASLLIRPRSAAQSAPPSPASQARPNKISCGVSASIRRSAASSAAGSGKGGCRKRGEPFPLRPGEAEPVGEGYGVCARRSRAARRSSGSAGAPAPTSRASRAGAAPSGMTTPKHAEFGHQPDRMRRIGRGQDADQLAPDPLGRKSSQAAARRFGWLPAPPRRAHPGRSARGSGRSAGCEDNPRRSGSPGRPRSGRAPPPSRRCRRNSRTPRHRDVIDMAFIVKSRRAASSAPIIGEGDRRRGVRPSRRPGAAW